jgi:hypothetical protein
VCENPKLGSHPGRTADPSASLRDDKFTLTFSLGFVIRMERLRLTEAAQRTLPSQSPSSMEALPSPCHPERTRISCHAALDTAACAVFRRRKPHEVRQRQQDQQEIRGSRGTCSAPRMAPQTPGSHANTLALMALALYGTAEARAFGAERFGSNWKQKNAPD